MNLQLYFGTPGTKDFNSILDGLGLNQTISVEYSITDNEMTLKFDFNNDGDFTDTNEGSLIYTKS